MIRKLRIKLILASMLSLLLVLTIILGVVGVLNHRKIVQDADSILALLQENDGNFPLDERMGNDLFSRCWSFLLQEVSPLRRRVGGFAVAPDAPSHCTSMFLDFSRCRGNRACGRDKGAFRSPP